MSPFKTVVFSLISIWFLMQPEIQTESNGSDKEIALWAQVPKDSIVEKYEFLLDSKKYDEALDLIRHAASSGGSEYIFLYGNHVTYKSNIDYVLGAKLFGQAAKLGHPQATVELAKSLFQGRGVDVDSVRALDILIAAAHQGNLSAAEQLIIAYWLGRGVRKSVTDAIRWANRLAYSSNHSSKDETYVDAARTFLKYRFLQGTEVPADTATAWIMMVLLNEKTRDDLEKLQFAEEFQLIESHFSVSILDSLRTVVEKINAKPLLNFESRFEALKMRK